MKNLVLFFSKRPDVWNHAIAAMKEHGLQCHICNEELCAIHWFMNNQCDLMILDFPELNKASLQLIQVLHRLQIVGVMVLLSRESKGNKEKVFEMGADSILEHPVDLDDFMLRVRSLIRRYHAYVESTDVKYLFTRIVFPGIIIDPRTRRVVCLDREISLSKLEFYLLNVLAAHIDRVLTHEELRMYVWNDDSPGGDNRAPHSMINRIRQKLDPFKCIETVRGIGYRFYLSSPQS